MEIRSEVSILFLIEKKYTNFVEKTKINIIQNQRKFKKKETKIN